MLSPVSVQQLGVLLAEQFWGLSHTCQPRPVPVALRESRPSLLSLCSCGHQPWARVLCPAGPLPRAGRQQPSPRLRTSSSSKEPCL